MSKVNAMQAMREARYAARKPVTAPAVPHRPAPVDAPVPAAASRRAVSETAVAKGATTGAAETVVTDGGGARVVAAELFSATPAATEAPEETLCGHRSMNNRICKRPSGHAEKNHRYN